MNSLVPKLCIRLATIRPYFFSLSLSQRQEMRGVMTEGWFVILGPNCNCSVKKMKQMTKIYIYLYGNFFYVFER